MARKTFGRVSHLRGNPHHLGMDQPVGGKDFLTPDREFVTGEIRQPASGLPDNEAARSGIPGMEPELPEAIGPATGEVTEVEGGGAVAPDALAPDQEGHKEAQVKISPLPSIVGKTGGQERLVQLCHLGDPNRHSVKRGPFASEGLRGLFAQGIINQAEDDLSLMLQGDGYAEVRIGQVSEKFARQFDADILKEARDRRSEYGGQRVSPWR